MSNHSHDTAEQGWRNRPETKLVPVPSRNRIPERDVQSAPVLECRNLGIDFGGLTAVNDFDIAIGRTEIAGLIGPNGAGKTTIFNLLTRVYDPTRGTILLDGRDALRMNTPQLNQAGIARTFQNIRLFKNLSVLENILIALHQRSNYSLLDTFLRLPKYWRQEKEAREKAMDLLSIFHLQDLAEQEADSLPYGAQRRLEIVRALATNPKILLLDEPAAGMNAQEKEELIRTIRGIRNDFGISVLIVEHDMDLIMNISDDITVLNYGARIAHGVPEEIQNNEEVIEAYLGRSDS